MASHFYIQTFFSNETFDYFKSLDIFDIRYDGIYSPYVLIASQNTSDEEIENSIYRLLEKNIFSPETDKRFGPINRFVKNHLDEVRGVLTKHYNHTMISKDKEKVCREYHYAFLDMLKQKPKLKRTLSSKKNKHQKILFLERMDHILRDIDTHKISCDMQYLKKQKKNFSLLKLKINAI